MARSVILRGFDSDMASRIERYMVADKTEFIKDAVPLKLEKPDPDGKILVTYA